MQARQNGLCARAGDALLAQRGGLFCWVPVCLGLGIAAYFSLRFEPNISLLWGVAGIIGALFVLRRFVTVAVQPLMLGCVLILVGAGLAKFETARLDQSTLSFRYYGPIEGRVVNIDRSSSDAVRLTLDRVRLDRMSPARTPKRVRVSLHGEQPLTRFRPGEVLMMTGHLSPPAGPAEPGGFDFQRHAYFIGLGAVGYTRTPVLRLHKAAGDWRLWLFAKRMALSTAVQSTLPGNVGGLAAAIMTGDRSGMGQDVLRDLRASNLAHLLAISGLHMGLLTGFIFALVRIGFALFPYLALRLPVKKLAAVCALVVGAGYLGLSGGSVATERAYIMVGVMFVAVLLDRRALTLRAVAMAATLVLVLQPHALMGPGFQMSFAATTALVVAFGLLRGAPIQRVPAWLRGPVSVVISSAVAGAATAPIAAAHFNQFSHYGLVANVVSVPLMGILVMPAAVFAVFLAPVGGWTLGLTVMGWGLTWILAVAQTVASWPGALRHVVAPDPWMLGLLILGLLWLILWRGGLRWAGPVLTAYACVAWSFTIRPALLVAEGGTLMGQMTPAGRALSREKGNGFVAGIWLENDGAPVAQDVAAARFAASDKPRHATAIVGTWRIVQVRGKTALAALDGCDGADVLVTDQLDAGARPCAVYDLRRLRRTGALAFDLDQDGQATITSARDVTGDRPWNAETPRNRGASSDNEPNQQAKPVKRLARWFSAMRG